MSSTPLAKRFPNLTSIRFLLALLVVIFHIAQFNKNRGFPYFDDLALFHKGTEAVYMFFSLSGFLIIRQLYYEKKRTNTINLKGFYLRRILRIFPLYYLILIFGFLYYRLILPYFGFEVENNYDLVSGVFLSVTFFPNIFSTYSPGGILEILWSIGVEEQFYLLIAPTLLLLPLKRIVLFLLGFTTLYLLLFSSQSFAFLQKYSMLFFYFSFSGVCAILLNKQFFQKIIHKLRYPLLLLCLVYFTSTYFKSYLPNLGYHSFGMVLFGLSIASLTIQPIKILEHTTLNYLGKISYGIYMFHPIAIQAVALVYLKIIQAYNLPNWIDVIGINLMVIALTIVLSHLSFKYYESYFLKMKPSTRKQSVHQIDEA